MQRPEHGWSTPCSIVRVMDGDTIEIIVTKSIKVRLLSCWSPEVHGEEKPEGIKAKKHMEKMALGNTGTLFVPTEDARTMSDIITLGRVLGHVWTDDHPEESLSRRQVDAGHAIEQKPDKGGLNIYHVR